MVFLFLRRRECCRRRGRLAVVFAMQGLGVSRRHLELQVEQPNGPKVDFTADVDARLGPLLRDQGEVDQLRVLPLDRDRGDLSLWHQHSRSLAARMKRRTRLSSSSTSFATRAIAPMRTSSSHSGARPKSQPSTTSESSEGSTDS